MKINQHPMKSLQVHFVGYQTFLSTKSKMDEFNPKSSPRRRTKLQNFV